MISVAIDGPAGVRLRRLSGIKATAFPVATALAASWNVVLSSTFCDALNATNSI